MEIVKREIKFIAVVLITLVGMFVVRECQVTSAREQAHRQLAMAKQAEAALAKEVAKSSESVNAAKPLLVGSAANRQPSLRAMTVAFSAEAKDMQDARDPLIDAITFSPGPMFELDASFKPTGPSAYDTELERFYQTRFQQRFARQPELQFVKAPNFRAAWNTLSRELGLGVYEAEAAALAGLVSEQPRSGAGGANPAFGAPPSRTPASRQAPSDEPSMSPEERKLKEAEARAKMQLIMLSVAHKVIEAGRQAAVARIDAMEFVPRDEVMRERFRVERNAPSFYRPIRVQIDVTANEARLMRFIENCVAPTFNNQSGQFLALDSFALKADECLNPEPADDLVKARLTLVAYLIDRNQSFERDDASSGRQTGAGAAGPRRPWRWR